MARVNWVLLVEDEADHRLLIREAIKRLAAAPDEFHEVVDAHQAIAWIRSRAATPQGLAHGVVILDLGLPGPSGFAVLEWVREQPVLNDLPVVVLTASENPMDADHAFNLGARGYFQKPADFMMYVEIFDRAFQLAEEG